MMIGVLDFLLFFPGHIFGEGPVCVRFPCFILWGSHFLGSIVFDLARAEIASLQCLSQASSFFPPQ